MKSFRLWVMNAVVLLSVGWLQADTISPSDGGIKLKTGGSGSITFSTTTCTSAELLFGFCQVSATPDEAIGADGSANIGVDNQLSQAIPALAFFVPTTNFNQPFVSSAVLANNSPSFQNSLIITEPFESAANCSAATFGALDSTCIEVLFFSGVNNTNLAQPCSATNPTNPCTIPPDADDLTQTGNSGFTPTGLVVVQAFLYAPSNGFPGLAANSESTLSLVSNVPEPSTFWVLLSGVVGLLVARRRLTAGRGRT